MVDNQIKAYIDEVHLLNLVVELGALEDLESVAIDVEDTVRLDFSMTRLDDRLVVGHCAGFLAHFLLVEAFYLTVPLLLDDLDDIALILGLEDREFYLDGTFANGRRRYTRLNSRLGLVRESVKPLLIIRDHVCGNSGLLV